jgi:voltage-gated potassium channel
MAPMTLRKKIRNLLLTLLGLLGAGGLGFHFLEGWGWVDSFYTTVVTLFTVGYGDFVPESTAGKLFAMGLILIGLSVMSYTAVELTAFVVEGHLNRLLRQRRVDKMIKTVSGHYIVCGAGKTGKHIVGELVKNKVPFVVIDRNAERLDDPEIAHHPHLCGDATDDAILNRAGIKKAKALAAALETDEANLFLLLTAKNLNHGLRVVTKVVNDPARPKLVRAGADAVVAPNAIGGLRLASEMLRPNVVSFLDIMLRHSGGYRFEEATVGPAAAGKTLHSLGLWDKFGIHPVAIRDGGKEFHYNPAPGHKLKSGDTLVLIAEPAKLAKLRKAVSA